jgi:hypothetical protein
VIVNYLDIDRTCIHPLKADPVLVVDPETVPSPAISSESLQSVARRHPQVVEHLSLIKGIQPPCSYLPEGSRQPLAGSLGVPSVKQVLRSLVMEAPDHLSTIARLPC